MEIVVTCLYCDNKMTKFVYDTSAIENMKCDRCGDKNLTAKETTKVDAYVGCPPFSTKKKPEPDYF